VLSHYMALWSGDLKVERDVVIGQTKRTTEAIDELWKALYAPNAPDEAPENAGPIIPAVARLLGEVTLLLEILDECESSPPPASEGIWATTLELWKASTEAPPSELDPAARQNVSALQRSLRRQLAFVDLQFGRASIPSRG
jgi:hypothetical protein